MALSLQEQLLKAGLADKTKAKKIRKEKHKAVKAKQTRNEVATDEAKEAALAASASKKAKDRALNEQQQSLQLTKAIAAQVVQLITSNKQPKGNGDVPLNFTDANVVKRFYVNSETHKHVTQGRLAVVKLNEGYELVPTPVAEKIKQRQPESVVYQSDTKITEEIKAEQNDWYADYDIPDDLVW